MMDSEKNAQQVAVHLNSESDQKIFYMMSERHTWTTSFLQSFNYYVIKFPVLCNNSTDNGYEITFGALKLSKSRVVINLVRGTPSLIWTSSLIRYQSHNCLGSLGFFRVCNAVRILMKLRMCAKFGVINNAVKHEWKNWKSVTSSK